MVRMLLLLLMFSSTVCAGNESDLGTGTSLAVCQPDTCALLGEVAALREKQAAMAETQSTLQQNLGVVMQQMASVEASLQYYKSQAEELGKINRAQDELREVLANVSVRASECAFTAALGGSVGPYRQDTRVIYQNVLSNIGSCYNFETGIFTARVRGTYYFSYTMYNTNYSQPNPVVSLTRNSQRVVSSWDTQGADIHDSASNTAVVQLNAGDLVLMRLYANRTLYDDGNYYNTFSGFMLFAW